MKRASSLAAIVAALLLHAGLIAVVYDGLSTHVVAAPEPLAIAARLLPMQQNSVPALVVQAPPEKKHVEPKPAPVKKPVVHAPKPRAPSAAEAKPAEPPPVSAAAPAAVAPNPASAPVKTGVYISADYAASNRKPGYPVLSQRYEEQGTVVLRVFVKADGSAGQVEIKTSSGYTLLDESAKSAVQSWRFRPATSDGKPVADWFLIPIPFKLQR